MRGELDKYLEYDISFVGKKLDQWQGTKKASGKDVYKQLNVVFNIT